MSTQNQASTASVLTVVRLAMLGGALVFGGAAWFVSRGKGLAPTLIQGAEGYTWGGLILLFLGLFGGVLVLRSRWQAAETVSAQRTTNIAGWALAEAAALVGAVYLLLVGDATFFGVGVALQALTAFVLLPLPQQ